MSCEPKTLCKIPKAWLRQQFSDMLACFGDEQQSGEVAAFVGINASSDDQEMAEYKKKQQETVAMTAVPRELEDFVSPNAWKVLRPEARSLLVLGELMGVCPAGIDAALWKTLSDQGKRMIKSDLHAEKLRSDKSEEVKYRSNVLKFFMHFESDDFNFDGGVSAMALICALLLTIPFGLLSFLNDSFWTSTGKKIDACGGSILSTGEYGLADYQYEIVHNLVCVIYASMSGLILSTFYYLFKPSKSIKITPSLMKRERILVLLLFVCCCSSVVGIMDITADMIIISVNPAEQFCSNPFSYSWQVGVAFLAFSFVAGLALMW